MNKKIRNIVILVMVAMLAVGGGTAALSSVLKADEDAPEAPVVEQSADSVAAEPEAPAEVSVTSGPTVVVEEITIEVPAEEEEPVEEPAEESDEDIEEPTEGEEEEIPEESEEVPEEGEEELEEEEEAEGEIVTVVTEVRITCNHKGEVLEDGTEVTLVADLEGIEGEIIDITWEYTADKGVTVHTASSHSDTLTFIADSETVNYLWRAVVTYEMVVPVEGADEPAIAE